MFRGVEVGWDVSDGTFVVVDGDVVESGVVNEVSTQESAGDFSEGHAFELGGDSSLPGSLLVQVVSEVLSQSLVLTEDDGVHSSTNPVAQISEVASFVSGDGVFDFIDDFDVVDQKALANVVEERDGGLEGLDHLEEGLEVNDTSLAFLDGIGDDLSSLTEELDTALNSGGVLALDITNSGGNVSNDIFRVSDAGSDLVESGGASDTSQQTFNEVQDVGLGVSDDDFDFSGFTEDDGVHGLTSPVTNLVVVGGFESGDDLFNFIDDFNVVDQKALANIVEERLRGGEGFNQLDEVLDISSGGLASSGGGGDDLSGLTQQQDTSLDSSGVLALDITDSSNDVSGERFSVLDAGFDLLEEFSRGDTVNETFDESGDISLDVLDRFGVAEDDGVHSLTNPVTELVPVLGFVGSDSLADLIEDINVVDDEALADVVEELDGALERLNQLDEVLDFINTGVASLGSVGDDLSSLAKKFDTLLDLSSILGLDVFNSSGDIRDDVFSIGDAGSDFIESGGGTNTVQETFNELEDISLGVIDRVVVLEERFGFIEVGGVSDGELAESASDKHEECDESDFS